MTTTTETEAPTYWIEWDMGEYGPFTTEAEARTYQKAHGLAGSSITRS